MVDLVIFDVETPCDPSVNINSESALLNHRRTYKKASIFSLLPTHHWLLIHQLASDSSSRTQPNHPLSDIDLSQKHQILSFFDLVKELSSKRITLPDSIW
ncbi:hypothetical protein PGT21_014504 [Puccinia graminis f. sp. tritici]|uniref:Uncharacterized protein n=1 Tax=Puccinia graminis f. sp. tritici TaxID=56615 RepID=A0A5B0QXB1_PUCGR|nr:hypothetical protein PGT21_014504 [Puccinia graminis f. sp. tritici]